jgi:phosphate transport system substrate-binding protein
MKKVVFACLLMALPIGLIGCSQNTPEKSETPKTDSGAKTPSGAQAIEGAGATFPKPIYEKWFADYQKATGTSVNYAAVGSGSGIKALQDKTVDFAASDAPASAADEQGMQGGPIVHIPTVGGAVVLAYNVAGIPTGLKLTGEIIAEIFLGKIKAWNDPKLAAINPDIKLPATALLPIHRSDSSGTTYIFTNYLKKASPEWASVGAGKSVNWPGGLAGKGNDGVSTTLLDKEGGIGYVELAYAIQKRLNFAVVQNHDGKFVAASSESTTAAIEQYVDQLRTDIKTPTVDAPGPNSYPICSLTYILLYKNGGRNTTGAVKLWEWAMQPEHQSTAKDLYYAPLPVALAKLNEETLKSVSVK